MEVKIYREPENENLILDENQLAEYNLLADELGLNKLSKPKDIDKTPNVYVPLNNSMQKQIGILCPSSSKFEKYTYSTIPLEVLKVYKFTKDNNMFDKYEIWYDNKEPDPVLIGFTWRSSEDKERGYGWNMNKFLIARWGDCALELKDLLEKGTVRIQKDILNKAKEAMVKCEAVIKNPEIYTNKYLSDDFNDMNIDLNINGSQLPF